MSDVATAFDELKAGRPKRKRDRGISLDWILVPSYDTEAMDQHKATNKHKTIDKDADIQGQEVAREEKDRPQSRHMSLPALRSVLPQFCTPIARMIHGKAEATEPNGRRYQETSPSDPSFSVVELPQPQSEPQPQSQPQPLALGLGLHERDMWRCFHRLTNEMIVTRSGRCLFPLLRFNLTLEGCQLSDPLVSFTSSLAPMSSSSQLLYNFGIKFTKKQAKLRWSESLERWLDASVNRPGPLGSPRSLCSNSSAIAHSHSQNAFAQTKTIFTKEGPRPLHYWRENGISFEHIKISNQSGGDVPGSAITGMAEITLSSSKDAASLASCPCEYTNGYMGGYALLGIETLAMYQAILEIHTLVPVTTPDVHADVPVDPLVASHSGLSGSQSNPTSTILNLISNSNPNEKGDVTIGVNPNPSGDVSPSNSTGALKCIARSELFVKEVQFVVVTHYRNQKVTRLKKALNPNAKGKRNSLLLADLHFEFK